MLDVILGQRHEGTLSHEGLRYQWMTYANSQLSEVQAEFGKGIHLEFVASSEDLGFIRVKHPRTKVHFTVENTRPDYASGLSLFAHKYLRHAAGIRLDRDTAVDTLAATKTRMSQVFADELEKRNTAGKAKIARIAGINSNAVLDGKSRSILTPFGTPEAIQQTNAPPPVSNIPVFAWGD
jgi:putative transposase